MGTPFIDYEISFLLLLLGHTFFANSRQMVSTFKMLKNTINFSYNS